jgi:hypothetical protein
VAISTIIDENIMKDYYFSERGLFQNIPVVQICFKVFASFDETKKM